MRFLYAGWRQRNGDEMTEKLPMLNAQFQHVPFGSAPGTVASGDDPRIPSGPVGAPRGAAPLNNSAMIPTSNTQRWIAISQRAQFGGYTGANITPGVRTGFTSRWCEQVPAGPGFQAIRLKLSGYYSQLSQAPAAGGSAGETPGINPVTYTASIETNTTPGLASWSTPNGGQVVSPPVTWNGQTSVIVPPTGTVVSDPIYIYMPGGTVYYPRVYANDPIGGSIPIRMLGRGNAFEGTNIGFTNMTWATGNGTATTFTGPTIGAQSLPLAPGSITFIVPGFVSVGDINGGNGTFTVPVNANGIASVAGSYTTGVTTITTLAPVANGATIGGWLIGGTSAGDQTQANALTPFVTSNNAFFNPIIGAVEIEGLPVSNASTRSHAVAAFGDSIAEGIGNTTGSTDTSWFDYSADGLLGVFKSAISGAQLASLADPRGRQGQLAILGNGCDRGAVNSSTNDLVNGKSLSQIINYFLQAQPALSAPLPHGASDLWWVTMFPRIVSATVNTPVVPASGPYMAAGAAYGPGAVVGGVQSCTITGNGTAGPYAFAFGGPTAVGALWSDGAVTSVIDTGAGGTGATTLTGSGVSTGTVTPSTSAGSLTLTSTLALGKTINLFSYLSGPSARNMWNHFLFNWAVPEGLLGGVIDPSAVIEIAPGSATGSGNGQWILANAFDGTHPNSLAHQTTIPAFLGPNGTNPSPFWMITP